MSRPGSGLRLDLGWKYSHRDPDICKNMIQAEIISFLWHGAVKRQLVEKASQCCPDFRKDIEITKGWSELNAEPREQDREGQPISYLVGYKAS